MKQQIRLNSTEIRAIAQEVAAALLPELKEEVRKNIAYFNDTFLPLSEICKMFDKQPSAIRVRCYRNQMPYHKGIGGEFLFSRNEIVDFIKAAKKVPHGDEGVSEEYESPECVVCEDSTNQANI